MIGKIVNMFLNILNLELIRVQQDVPAGCVIFTGDCNYKGLFYEHK